MTPETTELHSLNEHVLEIRYKPIPAFLDCRGAFGGSLLELTGFSEWRIDENRVDVYTNDEMARVFVAFRNAGAVFRNTDLPDYFPNQAAKFARHVLSQPPFADPIPVERLGVRSRFALAVDASFEELLSRFQARVLSLTKEAGEVYGPKIIDLGAPVVFQTSIGKVNSHAGPMERDQLSKFFDYRDKETLPAVSIYSEFDYWLKPSDPMPAKDILALIKSYAAENWQRHSRLEAILLGA
jgi:hypothetical protein